MTRSADWPEVGEESPDNASHTSHAGRFLGRPCTDNRGQRRLAEVPDLIRLPDAPGSVVDIMSSAPKVLPPALQGVFFDWSWETRKSWILPTQVDNVPFEELAWHLHLPVWSTVQGEMRFDLAPSGVLANPEPFLLHWTRILRADLEYPLEMFTHCGRWVILDGYHRLALHKLQGHRVIPVRRHPDRLKAEIRRASEG